MKKIMNWPRAKLYSRLGTETHLSKRGIIRHMFCINCGSRIPWVALVRKKWWTYTACQTCEGYTNFMCDPANFRERQPPPNDQWCVGCDPDNCCGCGPLYYHEEDQA